MRPFERNIVDNLRNKLGDKLAPYEDIDILEAHWKAKARHKWAVLEYSADCKTPLVRLCSSSRDSCIRHKNNRVWTLETCGFKNKKDYWRDDNNFTTEISAGSDTVRVSVVQLW